MRRAAVAIALWVGVACVPSEGPLMAPGQDCLGCHDGGGAPRWTVAGTTWKRHDSRVTITDSAGKSFTIATNRVGNFYSAERLTFPLSVAVDGEPMPIPATYGGCNLCHGAGAIETGPLMLPGQDCLKCHDGTVAPLFTAAGTWTGPGLSVTLEDANRTVISGSTDPTLVTNEVGNFYTKLPLALPLRSASVGGRTMSQPPSPSCNVCHPRGANADDG